MAHRKQFFSRHFNSAVSLAVEAGIVFAVAFFPLFEGFVKFFSNFFMIGRSPVKVYFFVIFLILMRRVYQSGKGAFQDLSTAFLLLMLLLYGLGLFEYLTFFHNFFGWDKSLLGQSFYVVQPPLGFPHTQLSHIHNSKAIFGYFLQGMGFLSQYRFFEAGATFVDFYPPKLLILHGVLYLLFFAMAFPVLSGVRKILPPHGYLVLGLAVLVNLKGVVDGGLLCDESWLFGIPIYLSFWIFFKKKQRFTDKYFWLQTFCIVGLFYASYDLLNSKWNFFRPFTERNAGTLPVTYLCLVLMAMAVHGWCELRDKKINALRGLLFLFFLALFLGAESLVSPGAKERTGIVADEEFLKGQEMLVAGWDAQRLKKLVSDRWITSIEITDLGSYAALRGKLNRDISYYELSRKVGITPHFAPICKIDSDKFPLVEELLKFQGWVSPCMSECGLTMANGFSLHLSGWTQKKEVLGREYCFQDINVKLPRMLPLSHNAVSSLMEKMGIQKAVLILRGQFLDDVSRDVAGRK